MSFSLEKWYLDLVTGDGAAVLGHAAALTWRGMALRYASRLIADPLAPPDERSALGEPAEPEMAAGRLSWQPGALGLHGEWHALATPIERTLLSSPAGAIEWACVMPRARAAIVTASARYNGIGYAERLRLTLPPWSLPFDTLRWGRYASERHALVWIEWDGEQHMRMAWLDGELQPAAQVATSGVAGLTNGRALNWHGSRDLRRRSVGAMLAGVAPAVAARVAGRLSTMQEHKQLATACLVDDGGRVIDDGWAIHEVVTW